MAWRIGVDSGGTFTDVCLFEEETGRVEVWKVPSTPSDPSEGIVAGLQEGVSHVGSSLDQVTYFGHGTTVSTNALIQGRGALTGLIVTDGFRDLLEIGRQKRPSLYDMQVDKPHTLADRAHRIGVSERVGADGAIELALNEDELRTAIRKLKADGVASVAICFLYSFIRPEHEEAAAQILADEFPEAFPSISSRIAPEFREYERMSTAVVNGYLGPVMQGYVQRLVQQVKALGLPRTAHLTQSNGGVISPQTAAQYPVRTVLSGPSTGVVAAQAIAQATGITNLITFDMGGTSSDVALLNDGHCRVVSEAVVHGYPIKAPMLDIHTVGAGGGSIAYVDHGGLLKVGPRSAGAVPGPACYNLGNGEPTVTDANVLMGTLNPQYLLNGRMKIDRSLSEKAVAGVAKNLGMNTIETAEGILDIVTANMAKAIRVISVQRGYDPRDYTLLAFGGAGPLHAARLAAELGISRVMVPPTPGIMCALGLLMTDLRSDFASTSLRVLEECDPDEVTEFYRALEGQAASWFDGEAIAHDRREVKRTVDVRYVGQNYEIAVDVPAGPIDRTALEMIRHAFLDSHKQLYGYVAEGERVQLVTYRLQAIGLVDKASIRAFPIGGADPSAAIVGSRDVWDTASRRMLPTKLYNRAQLTAGNVIEGPAIVDQMDSTTFVPSTMTARVDAHLNLILEQK